MKLFGSRAGTLVWLGIGVGTGALAVANDNQVTALIAAGWIVLAAYSYVEYRKET